MIRTGNTKRDAIQTHMPVDKVMISLLEAQVSLKNESKSGVAFLLTTTGRHKQHTQFTPMWFNHCVPGNGSIT